LEEVHLLLSAMKHAAASQPVSVLAHIATKCHVLHPGLGAAKVGDKIRVPTGAGFK